MQILNAIIRKYRAFKDFWHTHIATYTYANSYPHLKSSLNTNDFIDSNNSTHNTTYDKERESIESIQPSIAQNQTSIESSISLDRLNDFKSNNEKLESTSYDLRLGANLNNNGNLDSINSTLQNSAFTQTTITQTTENLGSCHIDLDQSERAISSIESKTDFSLNAQNDNNLDSIPNGRVQGERVQNGENPDSNPTNTKDTIHSTQNLNQANLTPLLHALKKPYITLAQLYNNHAKPHPLAKIFHRAKSMQMYYTILPLDSLEASNIEIEKSELRQANMLDSIVPLKAKSNGLIPYNYECKYFLQNQNKTHFNFQLFAIKSEVLESYALKYSGKILCLNPLEMFSSLFTLYPHLKRYTIIFQDSSKHALCHYIQGFLALSIVLDRTEALQNYYSLIEDFGEIFYCDFSGKADLLLDFKDIASLFNLPLKECLQLLALEYIRTKPTYIHFYARAFYSMRSFLKMLLFATLCIFIFYFLALFYHKYEYFQYLRHEALTHSTQIDSLYHKKQQYPLMYERLFKNLLNTQSLNFCLQQDYNEIESTWIQTDCNKP